jgi:hypothetical protein
MTRALAGAVLAIVAVGVAGADNAKERDEGKAIHNILQGAWATNCFIQDGQECISPLESIEVMFEGECVTERIGQKPRVGRLLSLIVKDEVGEVDLWFVTGVRKGIFKLERDILTLCLSAEGKDRPTSLESQQGQERLLVTMKRQKP